MNEDIQINKYNFSKFFKKIRSAKIIIPYFQREYKWSKDEINDLIDDILNSKTDNYYIGSIVIRWSHGSSISIIDGQQRITTFILIINSLLRSAIVDENIKNEYLNSFKEIFNQGLNFQSMNIKDGDKLISVIDGNNIEKDENNYSKNDFYLKDKIKDLKQNNKLNSLIKKIDKVIFSLVEIDSSSIDENILFEKINSTGIRLSNFDLIKNYLLSKIWNELEDDENKNNIIQKYNDELTNFSDFLDPNNKSNEKSINKKHNKDDLIKFFIAHENKVLIKEENLYKYFQKEYYGLKELSAKNVFNKLKKFAIYYKYFFNDEWKDEIFEKPMNLIKNKLNTFIVLLIRILEKNSTIANEKIYIDEEQKDNINKMLMFLECYIYRRTFVKLADKVITRKIPAIEINQGDTYKELFFKFNSDDEEDRQYRMPSFEELKKSIIDKNEDLYTGGNKKITHLFLYRLGTFNIKENIKDENLTIDHILPQQYRENHNFNPEEEEEIKNKLHTLGNLTLTAHNSEYSNKPFYTKRKEMLDKDNFPLNKYFEQNNIEKWDCNEINIRSKKLLEFSKEIWDYSNWEKEIDFIKNPLNNKIINNYDLENLDSNLENFLNDKSYKKAWANRTYFKKTNNMFTYSKIKQIIESYVCDGISYEDIEKTYFGDLFDGWLGQSIVEALEIKTDKKKIDTNDIENYIKQKDNKISELLKFIHLI